MTQFVLYWVNWTAWQDKSDVWMFFYKMRLSPRAGNRLRAQLSTLVT